MGWAKDAFGKLSKLFSSRRGRMAISGSGSFSMKGRRSYMEDRHFVIPCLSEFLQNPSLPKNLQLAGVFDGHGGHVTSTYASEKLPGFMGSQLSNIITGPNVDKEKVAECMKQAIYQTQENVSRDNPKKQKIDGSTAIVCLRYGQQLWAANVGDSRAILCRDEKPFALSIDHSPLRESEFQRIIDCGGLVYKATSNDCARVFWRDGSGGLAMTRALGDEFYQINGTDLVPAEPEIMAIDIDQKTDDYLLLVSDGLLETSDSNDLILEATRWIRKGHSPDNVCEELVLSAFNGGSSDNLTAVLVSLQTNQ